jgi:hypothetical protein
MAGRIIIAMLKRPSEFISQGNIKRFHSASAAYQRSLQSFCNFKQSAVSFQLSARNLNIKQAYLSAMRKLIAES